MKKDPEDINDLIASIEAKVLRPGQVHGTVIARVLKRGEGNGLEWSIGLGMMTMPKVFGHGPTIQSALKDAFRNFQKQRKK